MGCLNIATSQLPVDDYELLLDFVHHGKEEAFGQLVSRYANLVYFSALRQVGGESHLAEDIAQVVFVNLARKAPQLCVDRFAKLSFEPGAADENMAGSPRQKGGVLAGWLHRDTRFTALEFLRKANRRRAREQEVVSMESVCQDNSQGVWNDIRPLIDEALDQLSLQDRNALLLRFFERRSLAEVAQALETNDDAVRKRIDRALDKLRLLLKERGISTTAAALSALLIARPADVIAANLISQFAGAALRSSAPATAPVGSLSFVGTATFKSTILPLVGVLVAGVVGWYAWPDRTSTLQPLIEQSVTTTGLLNGMHVRSGTFASTDTNNVVFGDALQRLGALLNAHIGMMQCPDQRLQDAIDGLGFRKKESVPVLREALRNARMVVRDRACCTLQLLGEDGAALAPDISELLKTAGMMDAMSEVQALAKIAPESLYRVLALLKENSLAREGLAMAIVQIASRDNKVGEGFKFDKRFLEEVAKPLLCDPEFKVRIRAAFSIAYLPSLELVDPAIYPVIIEAMKSKDETIRGLGIDAFKGTGRNPFASSDWQMRPAPGFPGLSDAISALVIAAQESTNEDYRTEAFKLLAISGFDPKNQSSAFQATYSDHLNTAAFMTKISDPNTRITELADGLKTFPQITVEIAGVLGQRGNAAKEAVPALTTALNALEPSPEMGESAKSRARQTRASIVDALALIVPNRPRPLFSETDLRKIMDVVMGIPLSGDEERAESLQAALDPVLKVIPFYHQGFYGSGYELTPTQMRQVIQAVKRSGDPVYTELIKRVKEVDPHFAF